MAAPIEIGVDAAGRWVVVRDYERCGYVVPAGFATDCASVPRFLWRVAGPPVDPTTVGGAVLHDWLYATGAAPRAEADRLLRECLVEDGAGRARAWAYWCGVRMFGDRHYNNGGNDEDRG